jgi:hypothetical protein
MTVASAGALSLSWPATDLIRSNTASAPTANRTTRCSRAAYWRWVPRLPSDPAWSTPRLGRRSSSSSPVGTSITRAKEGYQADQIILLGEQLLPLIRPQVLVVDLIPGTIIFTGYASAGWPKPYFTLENGDLVAHNSPVPQYQAPSRRFDIRRFLGHLAVVDKFMAAFFADFWFTSDGNNFVAVSTDEVGVTCRLLQRLKQKTDAAGVRLLLYLQYGGAEVVDGSRMASGGRFYNLERSIKNKLKPLIMRLPPGAPDWYQASTGVGACARGLNIATVDELAARRTVYETNADGLRKYYQTEANGAMGHKSTFGNMDVAKRVAEAIGDLGPLGDQTSKR